MRCFGVDSNNDLFISGGALNIKLDLQAVLDVCAHAAKAILGEMVFTPNLGMPYFETVWVGNPTTAPFEAAFRIRVAMISGVKEIEELTASQQGDKMIYAARIRTIYGTGIVTNG